ncbi:MAG TPA: nuclear transport factor 2 family protein [Woeseiaceae bacterium]|nr:nuclear transport factor 2 family protein [Woeseiaceae bacterium]
MKNLNPNELLNEWAGLVNERNLDAVLATYDESAVLIPTFSNRLLNTPARIREYFETLCSREGLALSLHERPRVSTPIGGGLHALAGIYRWRFAVEDELLDFEARFTFVLDLERPAPILHHHSSQVPRML